MPPTRAVWGQYTDDLLLGVAALLHLEASLPFWSFSIIPGGVYGGHVTAFLLTIVTMICWGSWANVLKIAKGWRFQFLHCDYALGIFLAAVAAGLTLGTWGTDGLVFIHDLSRAGSTNHSCGFAGGVVFKLSNILVVGAISVAGLGVAFPVGMGLALVVGVIWNYIVNPQGDPTLLFTGVALIVTAIVVDALACRAHAAAKAVAGGKPDADAK